MTNLERVFAMSFASVYPHYVHKAEKKGRTKQEVNKVICWLTGYSPQALAGQIKRKNSLGNIQDASRKIKWTGLS